MDKSQKLVKKVAKQHISRKLNAARQYIGFVYVAISIKTRV